MGPKIRYLGPEVPAEDLIWQDPVPAGTMPSDADVARLQGAIANSGLTVSQLVKTAWASASTYRKSDHRGGANGARVRLEPQRTGRSTSRRTRQGARHARRTARQPLDGRCDRAGGVVAVEKAAKDAGFDVTGALHRRPRRRDEEQTDADSFEPLEPEADGFRNYLKTKRA
jgi:catalase-peroxidase